MKKLPDLGLEVSRFISEMRDLYANTDHYISMPKDVFENALFYGNAMYEVDWTQGKIARAAGFEDFLGIDSNSISLEDVITNLIHPDDRKKLQKLVEAIVKYGVSNDVSPSVLVLAAYRMRKSNGDYIRVLRTSRVGSMTTDIKMASNYSLLVDITGFDNSKAIKWDIRIPGVDMTDWKIKIEKQINFKLTEREMEVLLLIEKGKNTKEMAQELSISEETIKSHRKNLFHKLQASNVTELIYLAKEDGII